MVSYVGFIAINRGKVSFVCFDHGQHNRYSQRYDVFQGKRDCENGNQENTTAKFEQRKTRLPVKIYQILASCYDVAESATLASPGKPYVSKLFPFAVCPSVIACPPGSMGAFRV